MFQPIWVVFVFQGTKTPGLFGLQGSAHLGLLSASPKLAFLGTQNGAEMLHNPCIPGGPQQKGQNQSTLIKATKAAMT